MKFQSISVAEFVRRVDGKSAALIASGHVDNVEKSVAALEKQIESIKTLTPKNVGIVSKYADGIRRLIGKEYSYASLKGCKVYACENIYVVYSSTKDGEWQTGMVYRVQV